MPAGPALQATGNEKRPPRKMRKRPSVLVFRRGRLAGAIESLTLLFALGFLLCSLLFLALDRLLLRALFLLALHGLLLGDLFLLFLSTLLFLGYFLLALHGLLLGDLTLLLGYLFLGNLLFSFLSHNRFLHKKFG